MAERTAATAAASSSANAASPLQCVEEALSFLPLEEKLSFMEAVRVAPAVVSHESDPVRFWIAAGGNALAAAQNLCRYWRERKKAFDTPEQALLSLERALQPDDIQALQHGRPISILAEDTQGASVLYYDKTLRCNRGLLSFPPPQVQLNSVNGAVTAKASINAATNATAATATPWHPPSYFSPTTRVRLLFAACQTIASNALSQTDGCVFVLRVDPTETRQALRFHKSHLELGKYLAHVFPLRIKAWHVVALSTPAAEQPNDGQQHTDPSVWIQQTLPVLLARWEALLGKPAVIHAGKEPRTILQSLRQHGIIMDRLPPSDADEAAATAKVAAAAALLSTAGNTAATPLLKRKLSPAMNSSLRGTPPIRSTSSPSVSTPQPTPARVPTTSARVAAASASASTSIQKPPSALLEDWQRKTLQHAEDAGVFDDPHIRESGVQQLNEAIGFMAEHQKEAYLQAQRTCPQLVQAESDPVKFLRFHRYNAWSAAQRITSYWKKRKQIFGSRWLLPMTMTGNGAMNQEDITFARSGYFYFLPSDKDGRTVICYDPSRRVDHDQETRMRIGFYFWSIICENETCVRDGYVAIVLLGNTNFGAASLDGTVREKVDMFMDCFPTAPKNTHLVQTISRPNSTPRKSLLEMLLPLLFSLMGRWLENSGVKHVSESGGEMTKEFEPYGLSASGLPESAGGSWSFDEFYQWQLERCRFEIKRYEGEPYQSTANRAIVHPVTTGSSSTTSARPQASIASFFLSSPVQSHQHDLVQIDYFVRRLGQAEKAAYIEACEKAPALVRGESQPAWFSVHAKGDLRAAARQIAAYWTLRKQLFGDKAYLPMAQTGEGGLGRKDLILLSSSFFTVLPTKQKEAVILSYDCAKDDLSDEAGRLRVAFYILSLVAEREISRTEGFSIVASGLTELAKSQDDGLITSSTSFQRLLDVFPIRVAALHITMLLQPSVTSFPLDLTVQAMRRLFGSAGTFKGLVHVGTSRDEVSDQLLPYGIEKTILPRSLGGGFGYDRFTQWQELRIRYEWGLPAGANDREAVEIYDFSKVAPLPELSEEERKERKRRMNVVHSRRKRERERIEIEVLQEQCDELRDKKVVLTEECCRLEELFRQAQSLANTAVSSTDNNRDEDTKPPAVPNGNH